MTLVATLIIEGRYWFDFLTISWVVAFFLIEMVLLFRNSLLGWAMTAKCLVLAGVFANVLRHPPVPLPPADTTIESLIVRSALIVTLGFVILVLVYMRVRRMTVIVGREGDLPGTAEAIVRDQAASDREDALDIREDAAVDRELLTTDREGSVAGREGTVTGREIAVTEREAP